MLLRLLQVGNIVRVPVVGLEGGHQALYFRILNRLVDGKFRARVEDPYIGDRDTLLRNGDERVISRRDVMEVPLDWAGNENLARVAKLRDTARGFTGIAW
jgi:hypothetical protein